MLISGFYENVPVHFYEHRELAPDEKPASLVLEFDPQPSRDMLVACVWTSRHEPDLYSLAAITDEPTPEIAATGHQRTIITIQEQHMAEWLAPTQSNADQLNRILSARELPFYVHQIAA